MTPQEIQKRELENLLKSFISFKSVAESPIEKQECVDWVTATFFGEMLSKSKRGIVEGCPWVYVPHPDSKLLLFAHVDVVPASDVMFSLRVEGDKAFGRGVSDMKGPALAMLMAYCDAVKEGSDPPVSVLITTDEEVAGKSIPHLIQEGILDAPVAFTPDTNDLGIVCEHKGILWAELIASGKGGHGAYPWRTENPVWLLAEALEIIRKKFPNGAEDEWMLTVSPTVLSGSSARNQVADRAVCGLDIRYVPEQYPDADVALDAVAKVLPDGCELKKIVSESPLKTPEDHPMVLLYKEVAEEVLKTPIPFKREHGGTDARYFGENGIPAFLYGPQGGNIHSENEWVSISSLLKHYEIFRGLLTRLSND